jgi:hypothetical protein
MAIAALKQQKKFFCAFPLRRINQMRVLLLLIAVVAILALVGWITFSSEPGRSSVNIETQEIREDTEGVMKSGSDLLHKAGDEIDPNLAPTNDSPETPTAAPIR